MNEANLELAIKWINELIRKPASDRKHFAGFEDVLYTAADIYRVSVQDIILELNRNAAFNRSKKESN